MPGVKNPPPRSFWGVGYTITCPRLLKRVLFLVRSCSFSSPSRATFWDMSSCILIICFLVRNLLRERACTAEEILFRILLFLILLAHVGSRGSGESFQVTVLFILFFIWRVSKGVTMLKSQTRCCVVFSDTSSHRCQVITLTSSLKSSLISHSSCWVHSKCRKCIDQCTGY